MHGNGTVAHIICKENLRKFGIFWQYNSEEGMTWLRNQQFAITNENSNGKDIVNA